MRITWKPTSAVLLFVVFALLLKLLYDASVANGIPEKIGPAYGIAAGILWWWIITRPTSEDQE